MAQMPDAQIELEVGEIKPMKWEYISIRLNDNHSSLNKLGQEGWELVSVVFDVSGHALLAYFKRPIWKPE